MVMVLTMALTSCELINKITGKGNNGDDPVVEETPKCPGCNAENENHDKCPACGEYVCKGEHSSCKCPHCGGYVSEGTHTNCTVCGKPLCNGDDHEVCLPVIPDIAVTPEDPSKTYTYKDAVTVLSGNWNPHTYQTSDASYPISFITTGLYGFFYNDALNPVRGKDPYAGYVILPEMAAEMPVDVTEALKADGNKYGIPESATSGYAYTIKLNPDAKWENGTPINAETYVYSMKMLLDPDYNNYRASDYYAGSFAIANADKYNLQGTSSYRDLEYAFDELTLGEDGKYYTEDGNPVFIAVYASCTYLGAPLGAYVEHPSYSAYFDTSKWSVLSGAVDENGYAPLTDETYDALVTTISTEAWAEDESFAPNYMTELVTYEDNYDFNNVGIYASGEYEITLVLAKSLKGFNLLYNLSGNWIVYKPYYDASWSKIEDTDAWSTTYNTSLETTMSYGPYKMTGFVRDNSMTFERNENWFGYTDGKHTFVTPDGTARYNMYQTSKIETVVAAEAETRKLMFFSGELMGYGLQAEDFEQYRGSDYCYATPSETIFFFIFNGHKDAIEAREAAEDFDTTKNDLQTMTLTSFRQAVAVTFDKEAFASTISPSRSGGYGLIGNSYLYDPETGARYRDTDQAKLALCEFYSVDITKFDSLDDAVASITGFDVDTARVLYAKAYEEALAAGFITDNDGDGKSDQKIEIEYAVSEPSDFITKTLDYLNEKLTEVLVGTPFEGKISFIESAPLGDEWSNQLKAGMVDTCLAGWQGSALDPFGLTDLYTNPSYQYDAAWFDSSAVELTLDVEVDGEMVNLTMNLREWSDALNGATVEKDGEEYCFGADVADVETRLNILAAIETKVLGTYNYIPMLQDAGMALLSQQVYYVVKEYNPILGRGGITYMRYNYDDAAWDAYVEAQGGTLQY